MLRLLLILIACGVVLFIATAYYVAYVLLRPPRMTDGKAAWVLKRLSPGDLGLTFEPLTFHIRDERTGKPLDIASWWIPASTETRRCIVLLHGYADAKVGAIAWAPLIHELGWNILAMDLRAHGESGGRIITGGYFERHDVNQAINQLRAQRPEQTEKVALFGLSFGAAVAIAAADQRDDLAALILDSPFATYRSAEMAFCDVMGFPGRLVQRLAMRFYQMHSGAHLDEVSPVRLIPKIACPLMLIISEADPFVPAFVLADVRSAIQQRLQDGRPTASWFLTDAPHLLALAKNPEFYGQRVAEFLNGVQ